MNNLTIKTHDLERVFLQLQQHLGGELRNNPDEYLLTLDNDLVRGEISGVNLKNNFTYLQYDVTFYSHTIITSHTPITNPIYFLYCLKGRLSHSFGSEGRKRILNQYQTGIFSCVSSRNSSLLFRKDETVKGSVITVATTGKREGLDNFDLLRNKLIQTFMPKGEKTTFNYIGSYNLKISEQINNLERIKQTGIVRNLLLKGIVHFLLALEIQQHEVDSKNNEKCGNLTSEDLDEINELSNFIKNYPDYEYSIQMLMNQSGLSPAKLQQGFKFLHDMTVTNYIRKIRVEYAERLIRTTDLNITEIVYRIGLTSRSYFSKIFKDRFNCSPKEYQDNQSRTLLRP